MRRLTFILILSLLFFNAFADSRNGFAIIVDDESWGKCSEEILAYAKSVQADGFASFVAHDAWATPEAVRDSIRKWYSQKNLAGVVFIGDIPIPMIRKAQFLTSAFKMDENSKSFPWRDTSVPSDRFYDDFDLKFDFVKRDSVETQFFYYDLSPEGRQRIQCDIFSGRIKPSADYGDKHQELSEYLRKVVRLKSEDRENTLDRVASYTGAGSFSDCMIAWKDEGITLREQIPDAFKNIDGAKFFQFHQYPYIKDTLLRTAADPSLDLFLFHHHGTPDRQWIQSAPIANDDEEAYNSARLSIRAVARNHVRYGESEEEAKAYMLKKYPEIDSTWVVDAFDPDVVRADSLADLKLGIVLSDVRAANPAVRVSIFDACYNADFRESDCIANRYIFSKGNSIAAIGNSVNVLQDKHSSYLLGMMTLGYTIGEWHQMSAILESHVMGDPTFHFHSDFHRPDLSNDDLGYWKEYTNEKYPLDIRGLALQKCSMLNAEGMPKLLLDTYESSDSYMLRLQCLKLLQYYDTPELPQAMRVALDDPYEYIRRKVVTFLGMRGEDSDAELLARQYFADANAKRIAFNIENNAPFFRDSLFLEEFDKVRSGEDFIFTTPGKEGKLSDNSWYGRDKVLKSIGMKKYIISGLFDKDGKRRARLIEMMKNYPYPEYAGNLLQLVSDESLPDDVRISSAEILGWYIHAWNRSGIVSGLEEMVGKYPGAIDWEIRKSIARLNEYRKY